MIIYGGKMVNEYGKSLLWFLAGCLTIFVFSTLYQEELEKQAYNLRSENMEISRKYKVLEQEKEILVSIVNEEQKNRSRYNKLLGEDNLLKEDYAELKQSYEDLGKEFEQTVNMLENAVEDCKQTKKKK